MAGRIVEHLGPHSAYLEPFVGSCAVVLAKPPARMEVLNDLSGNLVNLIRVIASDAGPDLFADLQRVAFCEELYRDALAWLNRYPIADAYPSPELDVEFSDPVRALHYFVASWMGRNGLVGTTAELTSGFCVRYTSGGGDPATRFRAAVAAVPAWWDRLKNCTITRRNGIGLVERFEDRAGSVIYADPPYLDKQATYSHDFTDADHEWLAAALRRFRHTRVVVSYYAHERLSVLYPGWRRVAVATPKNLAVRTGPEPAPEVLLVNQST
jgi:DNA adenine methylase